MKDQEKLSLVAIDYDRRLTQELSIGRVKGFWGLRDSIDSLWERRTQFDVADCYLKIYTT